MASDQNLITIGQSAALLPDREGVLALSYVLDCSPGMVRAREHHRLTSQQMHRYLSIVERRRSGMPLQYAIGEWEFYGHLFATDSRALIPRPETELLVERVLQEELGGRVIADLGTGTGAIALTLALEAHPSPARILATDLSAAALSLAAENAARLKVAPHLVQWVQGDGPRALPESVDVLVSNPPYIDPADRESLQRELRYEPEMALYTGEPGGGGLAIYADWIPQLPLFMNAGGKVMFEIGDQQAKDVGGLLIQHGFQDVSVAQDYAGRDRIVSACWPGAENGADHRGRKHV